MSVGFVFYILQMNPYSIAIKKLVVFKLELVKSDLSLKELSEYCDRANEQIKKYKILEWEYYIATRC